MIPTYNAVMFGFALIFALVSLQRDAGRGVRGYSAIMAGGVVAVALAGTR